MQSILSKAKVSDVVASPFPHLVSKNAIDADICSQLIAEFPSAEIVAQQQTEKNNKRFSYSAQDVLKDERITPLWREFVRVHTTDAFLRELIAIFGDSIRAAHPFFEEEFGPLSSLRAGIRGVDTFDNADVLLDAQICVNTPVTVPSSVRGAHIDASDKLFAGLFYLRRPDDTSTGGDLEILRPIDPAYEIKDRFLADDLVECVSTVKYDQNMLVLFVNTLHSLHGVSVRSVTDKPRCFLNLVAEVRKPLFHLEDRREKKIKQGAADGIAGHTG